MALRRRHKALVAGFILASMLIIDQIIKIKVKTGMYLHDSLRVTDWFYISFIENEGMAYGMTFINKFVLTSFRIVAVIVIAWYICRQVAKNARMLYVILLTLVMAGAAGNIIDCVVYGQVFTASTPDTLAQIVPWGEGYAQPFYGKVVDMFYFPLIDTYLPDWVPFWGGDRFVFFQPVFNFADACISVGVVALLLFCTKEVSQISFSKTTQKENIDEEKADE